MRKGTLGGKNLCHRLSENYPKNLEVGPGSSEHCREGRKDTQVAVHPIGKTSLWGEKRVGDEETPFGDSVVKEIEARAQENPVGHREPRSEDKPARLTTPIVCSTGRTESLSWDSKPPEMKTLPQIHTSKQS